MDNVLQRTTRHCEPWCRREQKVTGRGRHINIPTDNGGTKFGGTTRVVEHVVQQPLQQSLGQIQTNRVRIGEPDTPHTSTTQPLEHVVHGALYIIRRIRHEGWFHRWLLLLLLLSR